MKSSRSQRIARLFEILNYFLLLPTSLIEIAILCFGLVYLVVGSVVVFIVSLAFTMVYAFGTLLLYGYYKHSRGQISKETAILLWLGTILFNLIPFGWMCWIWTSNDFTADQSSKIFFYNIFGGYLSILLLAIVALINDLRSEFD